MFADVAAHPGAESRDIARPVGAPERVVVRNLSWRTENGLEVLVGDDVHPALTYRPTS
ncbi:hypothetical protein QNN03_05330 [Streptomyces sp. GXMU-J15]|uniref:UbiC transcription regulator-associated domain-containing protein n=1 Tax=Streptomyces fuscus TaxID=3048495 RepID=A0ABT7ITE3_9ACTN|nr:hypothetical protein [Streptomyces fuscus]